MSNIFQKIKREIIKTIPAVIFFFIVFQLLAFTRALILQSYGIQVSTFINATIVALLVGKVVLIADHLPLINQFPNKPLIYNIVWKTLIYLVSALIVRYLEHLIPLVLEFRNLGTANQHLLDEVIWPHFWVVQIWLLVCFFMYCTIRELVRILGRKHVLTMFFGPARQDAV